MRDFPPPVVPDPSRPRKPPRLRGVRPAPPTEADFAEFEREVAAAEPEAVRAASGADAPPAPERPRSAAAVLREAQGGREIEGERCLSVRGMTQPQARSLLEGFLRKMRGAGVRCVKVIHGKGNRSDGEPVLRRKVPEWLGEWKPELVAGYEPVRRERKGGSGALFVALTPPASRGARVR